MWANVQRDGRPAEYTCRWRPELNAAKLGSRPLLDCRAVTLPIGQRKIWRTQSEFCTWQNSVTEQQPPKMYIRRVSKNVPPCYNFDAHEWILIFFGRNVTGTDKVGNQKTLCYATSSNLYFCTTWQNMKITYFTQLDCVIHTMHMCAVFLKERKKIVICDVFDSV